MSSEKYDAVLTLGGGIRLDGSLTDSVQIQVQKAVEVFRESSAEAFIASGLYGYKGEEKPVMSEAKAYATYAESLGVDPSRIYLEERSQETVGNILFTKMSILIPNGWTRVVVVPTSHQLTERIEYLLQKILGPGYEWTIVRAEENLDESNVARELKSFALIREINDEFTDGDHEAIYQGLLATHPAYGGTKWTVEELRQILG